MLFNELKNPIFLFKSPIHIRQNHEGLGGIVRKHFGEDFLYSGAAFVFVSKNRLSTKILFYDGKGLIVVHKKFIIQCFGYANHLDDISKVTKQELELLFSGKHLSIALKKP